MNQGVIDNFKVHYQRRVIKRLLINVRTADNVADMKTPLVKAIFATGAWRDVKCLTIALCSEKASFSRSSSTDAVPAGDEAAAVDVTATADGITKIACLDQLWESASRMDLVPPGLGHMDFVLSDDDHVVTVHSASNSDCDDAGRAPKLVTSAAADTIRMYLVSSQLG
ncbi:hypothetical protein V5799_014165 [Amblyomma americanum]|uniref:DDE-1 domain-containing protein n=1 Tax=Amblyomma americanum TaxID=6943 RepID=A0AAQ4E3U5_AMBAM